MPRFARLVRNDLDELTRAELLDRIETEQAYWARKVKSGRMTDADREAEGKFIEILHAALNPADALADTKNLVLGVRSAGHYWDQVPGQPEA